MLWSEQLNIGNTNSSHVNLEDNTTDDHISNGNTGGSNDGETFVHPEEDLTSPALGTNE